MYLNGQPQFEWSVRLSRQIEFKMLSVREAYESVQTAIKTLREINSTAHVVLTLSPIPLKISPVHSSVFGQDCLSKSILRVAIDTILADGDPNLSYWPSFELIRWLGGHVGPFFGADGAQDSRHISPAVLDAIMQIFIERYFL